MVEEDYPSLNDDILGGLRSAVARGETLKEAMMSLYNAGYSKEEIEEGARKYLLESSEDSLSKAIKDNQQKKEPLKKEEIKEKTSEKDLIEKKEEPNEVKSGKEENIEKENKERLKAKQRVSDYGEQPKKVSKREPLTITLIILLVSLVGVLVAVFLFKQEIIEFFNNLLG